MTWILGSTDAAPELAGRGKVPLPSFNRVVELFSGTADTLQYETLTREISSLGLQPFHRDAGRIQNVKYRKISRVLRVLSVKSAWL